jgi:outer membrane protein TolC
VLQANAVQYLFNRPQSLAVAQAKEDARGAALATTSKRDEVAYRTAALYLDAERAARIGALVQKDAESRQGMLETVRAQVQEGRALPLAAKEAALQIAQARQVAEDLEDQLATAETALAVVLGYSATDRVRPLEQDRPAPPLPGSEAEAMQSALESNKDLRRLQSQIMSKELEIRGQKAQRLPRADLVAQYGLFATFNNYQSYFKSFQRNNAQFGVSFQLPVFTPGVGSIMAQTQTEVSRLKIDLNNQRNRISSDIQQSFRDLKKAETASEVASLALEVARESLSVKLAQMQEGRQTLGDVEIARIVENQKWIAFYDAHYATEKARWNVLRLTGTLVASIETLPDAAP